MFISAMWLPDRYFLEIAKKVYATATDMHPVVAEDEDAPPDLPFSKTGNRDELKMVLRQLDVPIENKRIHAEWVTTEKQNDAVALNGRKIIAGLVPNVVSMGAKDAIYLLENAGLRVRMIGRGSVRSQSIDPGSPVRKGDQIILEMSFI